MVKGAQAKLDAGGSGGLREECFSTGSGVWATGQRLCVKASQCYTLHSGHTAPATQSAVRTGVEGEWRTGQRN